MELEAVRRAVHSTSASVQDMGIDHGRTDVLMPKELLDRPDVVAVLKEMGGPALCGINCGMAKYVGAAKGGKCQK